MKFKDKVIQFMSGRNGGDQLSTFLIVVSLALSLAGQAANLGFLVFAGYLPLGYALFRILSRNVEKRRLENYKFAILLSPLYGRSHRFATRLKMRAEEAKRHKYVKCPQCKAMMRVPRGKGKLMVTCPKCQNKFPSKS